MSDNFNQQLIEAVEKFNRNSAETAEKMSALFLPLKQAFEISAQNTRKAIQPFVDWVNANSEFTRLYQVERPHITKQRLSRKSIYQ